VPGQLFLDTQENMLQFFSRHKRKKSQVACLIFFGEALMTFGTG
jgi:hypothetical protein